MTLSEIEFAIEQLSPVELSELLNWFERFQLNASKESSSDKVLEFGRQPVLADVNDASINHDRYLQP